MELSSLPKSSSSLKFSKHNAHIMSLCLTLHVDLGLSLRKTAQAMNDLYGIKISHQMVANYARTAALIVKPFVCNYDYEPSNTFVAQERQILLQLLSAHKASANSLIFNVQLSIFNSQFVSPYCSAVRCKYSANPSLTLCGESIRASSPNEKSQP